jgi:hypothetical protein
MFRISIIELGLTCGLFVLIILIPWIVARYSSRMDRRLKDIEKRIDQKSK